MLLCFGYPSQLRPTAFVGTIALDAMEQCEPAYDEQKARQLRFAVALTACVLAAEIAGGLWTRSLALLSDAGHVFSDVFSLALSLLALRLASLPPTDRHSYGLHRAEILAALVNGLSLLVICVLIGREAYVRFQEPPEVRSVEMLIIAAVGMAANWLVASRLQSHSHGDINLRSAYLHVVGDLLASIGVVVGAGAMAITGWHVIDPAISVGIGLIVLVGAVRVTLEAVHVLLEGVPPGVDVVAVVHEMTGVDGVLGVHHLHAWSVCSNLTALSAHVNVCEDSESERSRIRKELENLLQERFGFQMTTLQIECEPPTHEEGVLRHFRHGLNHGHAHGHSHEHADAHDHDSDEHDHEHDSGDGHEHNDEDEGSSS